MTPRDNMIVVDENCPRFELPFMLLRKCEEFALQNVQLLSGGKDMFFVQCSAGYDIDSVGINAMDWCVGPVFDRGHETFFDRVHETSFLNWSDITPASLTRQGISETSTS